MHLSSSQAFSSSSLLNRSRGVKKRSRIRETSFSTSPFSYPDAACGKPALLCLARIDPHETSCGCGRAGHERPSRSPSRRSAGRSRPQYDRPPTFVRFPTTFLLLLDRNGGLSFYPLGL